MDNILILLVIMAVVVVVQTNINSKQSREIDKLSMLVDWRTKDSDDRLNATEKKLKVVAEDNRQLSSNIQALEGKITALEDDIKRLESKIIRLTEILEIRPEPEDNKMAEQWENIINFNPLKDLEVTRGN